MKKIDEFLLKKTKTYDFEGVFGEYTKSPIIVLGIPFDGTCSNRAGTRFGPMAIRSELDGLETYSMYQDKDLIDYNICDIGNLELPFGNTSKVMEIIYENTREIIKDDKKIITLGGEHLISYPVIEAYVQKYPELNIIHLDAHADLRDDYIGEKLSHATVMKRVFEVLKQGHIYQWGIRSGTKEEIDFAKKNTDFNPFSLEGIEKLKEKLKGKPVYLSIDLDVLDPSVFAGTGTPEPGGVTFKELIKAILSLKGMNIVGADIVELSPDYDISKVSNAVAAKILREVALIMS